jgi:hypothetical protein
MQRDKCFAEQAGLLRKWGRGRWHPTDVGHVAADPGSEVFNEQPGGLFFFGKAKCTGSAWNGVMPWKAVAFDFS